MKDNNMAINKAALDEIKLAYQEATAELAALKIRQKQEQVPLIIRTQSLRMRLRRAMAGQEQNHLDYVEAKLTYDAEQSARHAPAQTSIAPPGPSAEYLAQRPAAVGEAMWIARWQRLAARGERPS